MYLEGNQLKKIIKETGIKQDSLKYHIKKGWKAEREAIRSELVDAMSEEKRVDLIEITSYGLTFLKQTLKKLVEDANTNPTPGLLKTISTIVFEINKIKALDEGNPTEILAEIMPASNIEIRELINKDPFAQIEEAELLEEKNEEVD